MLARCIVVRDAILRCNVPTPAPRRRLAQCRVRFSVQSEVAQQPVTSGAEELFRIKERNSYVHKVCVGALGEASRAPWYELSSHIADDRAGWQDTFAFEITAVRSGYAPYCCFVPLLN